MDYRFRFQQQDTEMHCQSYFAKRNTFRNGNSSRRSSPPSRLTFGNTTSPGEYTPMPDRAYPWLTHTSITVQPNGVQLALKRACYFPQPTSRAPCLESYSKFNKAGLSVSTVSTRYALLATFSMIKSARKI